MPTKILIIDDDGLQRELVKAVFEKDNYEFFEATDAKLGFTSAIEHMPQLIVADMRMPRMSGLEFVEAARAHPDIKHIPIVISTANHSIELAIECQRKGANDFFTKPLDIGKFRRRIKQLLGHPPDA